MTDIPLPGTRTSTLVVNGTVTDWIKPIEDCVYDYIYDKWSIDKPLKTRLKSTNKEIYDGNGSHHIWIERGQTVIMEDTIDGWLWHANTTLNIFCLMKRLGKGKPHDDLDDMTMHIRTLLIEYSKHWIAGIHMFNNFVITPMMFGPEDERNPFQGTWIDCIQVQAIYDLSTGFVRDNVPYQVGQHSAGELSYKLNSS